MQLVLDDEIRGQQPFNRELAASAGIAWAVKSFFVVAMDSAEERAHLAGPRQSRKLVNGSDDEAGQPAIDRLVHGHNRQPKSAAELAVAVDARDAQVARIVGIGL